MLLVGGENLFDLISDTTKDDLSYKAVPGGSPYNTAIAAGKLGAHTAYISPVSKDTLGQSLLDHLAQAQVLHWGSRVEAPTSLALVNINQGQASYQFYREQSAERQIDLDQLKSACLQSVESSAQDKTLTDAQQSILHIGSLALTGEEDGELWCQLFEWAQSTMFCSVDLNIRPRFVEDENRYRQRLLRVMNSAQLIKLSDEDLWWWLSQESTHEQDLGDHLSDELIKKASTDLLHRSQAQLLIVTQGSLGSHLFLNKTSSNDHMHTFYPAFKTEQLKDTVGAGDTFMGAFLSQVQGLIQDNRNWTLHDLEKALAFASMAAMMNCERLGCQPPHQSEVHDRLKRSSET
ncbi:MAG: carbohydrate kinase [Myxococcales bacterium]|nr:carbohydrate kinase [Myxococcales bacterium]